MNPTPATKEKGSRFDERCLLELYAPAASLDDAGIARGEVGDRNRIPSASTESREDDEGMFCGDVGGEAMTTSRAIGLLEGRRLSVSGL